MRHSKPNVKPKWQHACFFKLLFNKSSSRKIFIFIFYFLAK